MSSEPRPVSPRIDLGTRRVTLLSFWLIFLLVGVPLWWNTTALERRPLPHERIRDLKPYPSNPPRSKPEQSSRVAKYSRHYKLVFSLLNENSSSREPVLSWDIQPLLDLHFKPLLDSLAPLHDFTIESQIQYYAPLAVSVHEDQDSPWIHQDDAKAFVNNAQWNLAAGTTLDPVLHFILYVPAFENRPLGIKTSQLVPVTSFITPQRGGLVIHNPTSDRPNSIDHSFETFSHQLRLLLGLVPLDTLPRRETSTTTSDTEREVISRLVETRLEEAFDDAIKTLSILSESITNPLDGTESSNVSVGSTVQSRVVEALDLIDTARTCKDSNPPCSPATRLSLVSRAQTLSNLAYFDPTLLPMLYFPQEHKYAVYTPLFGPVSVPLIVGLIRELKEWRERRRGRKPENEKVERQVLIEKKAE